MRRRREGLVRLAASRPAVAAASACIALWGLLSAAETAATTPAVSEVRLGVHENGRTRIVLDMDARPDFTVTARRGNVIEVSLRGGTLAADGVGIGLVERYHGEDGRLRVALAEPALPVAAFVLPPSGGVEHHRLVIDLAAATAREFAAAAVAASAEEGAPEPARLAQFGIPAPSLKPRVAQTPPVLAAAEVPEPPRASHRSDRRVIVIDPGHGGHDPGASGPSGLAEEDVTLAAAKALRLALTARGYEVVLTRDADAYVQHEDRIELARSQHADLFLSLHADALTDPSVRGGSVYTLSDQRAGRMASQLRASGDFQLYDVALSDEERDVGDILLDLASSATHNESARFAARLVDEMQGRVEMVGNTHRKASLKVLLAPDVPAVLLEMAFISNPDDEKNLASPTWRRRAMQGVADAIDAYFADRVAQMGAPVAAGG